MQKDVHFYLTYVLARQAGICPEDARKLAWSDQHTDDLTKAELHGIQTQSAVLGNWLDRQIQRSVLVPFHFLPGDEPDNPWLVTAGSRISQILVDKAIESKDMLQVGIALHALQDTFSHQGFTGWDEPVNACFPWYYIQNFFPWYYIQSNIPNIGHAEMQATPDIVSAVWTDPRTGRLIDNKVRTFDCAMITFEKLTRITSIAQGSLSKVAQFHLHAIFQIDIYDLRKQALIDLVDELVRYKQINTEFCDLYRQEFISAASRHLAAAIELMKDLPLK